MKRVISIYFICLFLFISPIYSRPGKTDTTNSGLYAPAAANDIQRVYGIDLSQQVFNTVSINSYRNFIIQLTENGSRPAGYPSQLGDQNIAARNWIAEQLKEVSNGRIEVEILGHYASVLGKLPGYLPVDAPALMIGGHYDSVPAAPGANDDATGVAAALELARVMSRYNWPLDIYFGAWNAEEDGLLGSTEVATIMKDRGVELLAYYNVDMLLVPDPAAPQGSQILMAYPVGYYHEGAYWADIA
ncbi:MAG: M20/M25/M40 family metallo-hydrolase, partial [Candidatus Thorarchaeota archaeon]|nr:M20/M25/M40 family metallo-hydrolase [Candidatus Thorarchaeota archaeon]